MDADERLLVEAAQRDPARFGDLYDRHFERVYAFVVRRVPNRDAAEDVTADVFHRALAGLRTYEWRGVPFAAWLLRIAVNVSLNWKRNRRATEPWDDEQTTALADSPETIVLLRMQVSEALEGLPPHHRAVLLLREMEGWTVEEIGGAMGWNTKRVYNELFKARRAVAQWQARNAAEGAGQ